VDTELAHQVLQVRADRIGRQLQALGYLEPPRAGGQADQNLPLALGQRRQHVVVFGLPVLGAQQQA